MAKITYEDSLVSYIIYKGWIRLRECVYDEMLALLQKQFVVPTVNQSLVPAIECDTLCVIQKMTHFLYRLMSTDMKDPLLEVRQAIFDLG
jgi:hypothetical protein